MKYHNSVQNSTELGNSSSGNLGNPWGGGVEGGIFPNLFVLLEPSNSKAPALQVTGRKGPLVALP